MRTVLINNQKGGVGKTTIALHLAWHFVAAGERVLFIDLDAQANASATLTPTPRSSSPWTAVRAGEAADLFAPAPLQATCDAPFQLFAATSRLNSVDAKLEDAVTAISAHKQALGDHFALCVIDTPPAFGARNLGAMMICDHLLAPIQLEDYAIIGVNDLLKSIAVAERLRGKSIDFIGLLPSQFRAASTLHRRNLSTLISALGRSELLLPAYLGLRQAYAEAVARGVPVWTIRGSSAATLAGRELQHVISVITARMRTAQ